MGTMFAAIVWFTIYVLALLLPQAVALIWDPIDIVRLSGSNLVWLSV